MQVVPSHPRADHRGEPVGERARAAGLAGPPLLRTRPLPRPAGPQPAPRGRQPRPHPPARLAAQVQGGGPQREGHGVGLLGPTSGHLLRPDPHRCLPHQTG